MNVEIGETFRYWLPVSLAYDAINHRLVGSPQYFLTFTVTPAMLAEVLKGRKRRAKKRNP